MSMDDAAPAPEETPAVEPAAPLLSEAVEPVAETPAEPVAEVPAEAPAAEVPAETPAEEPAEPIVEPVAETPAEPVAEAPAEEVPAEVVAEEPVKPVYEDFELPEGIQADPEQMTAYHEVLGKYGLTQEAGQDLIDLHTKAIRESVDKAAEQMAQHQTDVFVTTQNDWRQQFYDRHPQNHNTVLETAKFAAASGIKNAEQRKAFWGALALTGAGNHPDVVEGLAAIGKLLKEGATPVTGRAVAPDNGLSKADKRYGARS